MKYTLWAIFFLLSLQPVFAQQDVGQGRVLKVVGQATIAYPATHVEVALGIETPEYPTAQEAQTEAARVSSVLVDYLKSVNVAGLETLVLRVQPSYKPAEDRDLPNLYRAENIIAFRTQPKSAGAILDKAIALGATRIDSSNAYASEKDHDEAKKKAITKATENAIDKAQAALVVFGAKIQNIRLIAVDPSENSFAPMAFRTMAADAPANASAFEVSALQASARVLLEIAF